MSSRIYEEKESPAKAQRRKEETPRASGIQQLRVLSLRLCALAGNFCFLDGKLKLNHYPKFLSVLF
jgi:hypothetical protein